MHDIDARRHRELAHEKWVRTRFTVGPIQEWPYTVLRNFRRSAAKHPFFACFCFCMISILLFNRSPHFHLLRRKMKLHRYLHASVLVPALRSVKAEKASYNSSGIANTTSASQQHGAHTIHSPSNTTKVLSNSSSSCVLYSENIQLLYFDECEASSDPLEDVTTAWDDYTL